MVDPIPVVQKTQDLNAPTSTDLQSNVAKLQTVSTVKVSEQYSEPTIAAEKPQLLSFENSTQLSPQDAAKMIVLAQQRIVNDIADSWVKNTQEVAANSQQSYEKKIHEGLDTYSLLVAYLFQSWLNQAAPGVQAGEAGISKVGLTQEALSVGNAVGVAPGVSGTSGTDTSAFHSHQQVANSQVVNPEGITLPAAPTPNAVVAPVVPATTATNKVEPTDNQDKLLPAGMGVGLVGILAAQVPLMNSILERGVIDAANAGLAVPGTQLNFDLSTQMVNAQMMPIDMTAALAMMAALIGASLMGSSAVALAKAEGTNPDHYDKKYVEAYIEQVQKLVKSPLFDQLIQLTIIAQLEAKGVSLTPNESNNILAASKLVYLLSALAAYYKAETGSLTSEEIAGLINGEIQLPENDPRKSLIEEINNQRLVLDQQAGVKFWESALAYFDSKPAMKDLLQPTEVFKNIASSDEAHFSTASALSA